MMNEQIKALMGQTLDEKFSGTWSTMDMQDLQKFAERFAELIVLECGDFVATALMKKIGQISASVIATDLVEHFGVEV